jgi:hypothetical protein
MNKAAGFNFIKRKSIRACGLLAALALSGHALALDLHVAPAGNDTNPGTEAAPLATLAAAEIIFGDVVQLYVTGQYFGIVRPGLELKGFARVKLEPGESRAVRLKLNADDLMFHDPDLKRVLPVGGEFLVSVGGSSAVRTKPVVLKVGN